MGSLLEGLPVLCLVLIATEVMARLCPQEKTVGFVQGLVAVTLLCSAVAALFSASWDFSLPQAQAEGAQAGLVEYINGQYQSATEAELEKYLRGLLGAAGLQAKKIEVEVDITGDSRIVLAKVNAAFTYPVEQERAAALLRGVLGDTVEIEVTADGA